MTAPYYISKTKSDMRGIKHGWYVVEDDGSVLSRSAAGLKHFPTDIRR
jgi:hypothetical protein